MAFGGGVDLAGMRGALETIIPVINKTDHFYDTAHIGEKLYKFVSVGEQVAIQEACERCYQDFKELIEPTLTEYPLLQLSDELAGKIARYRSQIEGVRSALAFFRGEAPAEDEAPLPASAAGAMPPAGDEPDLERLIEGFQAKVLDLMSRFEADPNPEAIRGEVEDSLREYQEFHEREGIDARLRTALDQAAPILFQLVEICGIELPAAPGAGAPAGYEPALPLAAAAAAEPAPALIEGTWSYDEFAPEDAFTVREATEGESAVVDGRNFLIQAFLSKSSPDSWPDESPVDPVRGEALLAPLGITWAEFRNIWELSDADRAFIDSEEAAVIEAGGDYDAQSAARPEAMRELRKAKMIVLMERIAIPYERSRRDESIAMSDKRDQLHEELTVVGSPLLERALVTARG